MHMDLLEDGSPDWTRSIGTFIYNAENQIVHLRHTEHKIQMTIPGDSNSFVLRDNHSFNAVLTDGINSFALLPLFIANGIQKTKVVNSVCPQGSLMDIAERGRRLLKRNSSQSTPKRHKRAALTLPDTEERIPIAATPATTTSLPPPDSTGVIRFSRRSSQPVQATESKPDAPSRSNDATDDHGNDDGNQNSPENVPTQNAEDENMEQ